MNDIPAVYELVWRIPRESVQHRLEFDSLDAANSFLDSHIKPVAKEWDLYAAGVLVNNGYYCER